MKVNIEVEENETRDEVDAKLLKALKSKQVSHEQGEEYTDPVLNQAHSYVSRLHSQVVSDIVLEVSDLFERLK